MTQTLQNSYLQRYQQKHSRDSSPRPTSALKSGQSPEANNLGSIVSKLGERVDGVEVKLTSLVNVVKLLQKYTESKDDQYQKEKENNLVLQYSEDLKQKSDTSKDQLTIQTKAKEFQLLTRQFKEELKSLERIKGELLVGLPKEPKNRGQVDTQGMEQRLREQINKKMEICMQLITDSSKGNSNGLADKIDSLAFDLNQLEHHCKRGQLALEQEVQRLESLISCKEEVSQKHSRSRQKDSSTSPNKVDRKASKSDKSLSKGNARTVASRIRDQEMKQALRKKKEHRQRLKARNN